MYTIVPNYTCHVEPTTEYTQICCKTINMHVFFSFFLQWLTMKHELCIVSVLGNACAKDTDCSDTAGAICDMSVTDHTCQMGKYQFLGFFIVVVSFKTEL